MQRKLAISDIHGNLKTFQALLQNLEFSKTDTLYLLGNYIDLGPDSKGLIDLILQMQKEGYNLHCLRGNHEQMFLDALTDDRKEDLWRQQGGMETLLSYGVETEKELPVTHIAFFEKLEFHFDLGKYILVHAGLDMKIPEDTFLCQQAMIERINWYQFINYLWLGDRIIVHGHTPMAIDRIVAQQKRLDKRQYLCINGGCHLHHQVQKGFGKLCAFDLDDQSLYFQENIDMV